MNNTEWKRLIPGCLSSRVNMFVSLRLNILVTTGRWTWAQLHSNAAVSHLWSCPRGEKVTVGANANVTRFTQGWSHFGRGLGPISAAGTKQRAWAPADYSPGVRRHTWRRFLLFWTHGCDSWCRTNVSFAQRRYSLRFLEIFKDYFKVMMVFDEGGWEFWYIKKKAVKLEHGSVDFQKL